MTSITNNITILPGDDLILECYYNSMNRDSMTWGGTSTLDEMCVFLFVYPKQDAVGCISQFTLDDISTWARNWIL